MEPFSCATTVLTVRWKPASWLCLWVVLPRCCVCATLMLRCFTPISQNICNLPGYHHWASRATAAQNLCLYAGAGGEGGKWESFQKDGGWGVRQNTNGPHETYSVVCPQVTGSVVVLTESFRHELSTIKGKRVALARAPTAELGLHTPLTSLPGTHTLLLSASVILQGPSERPTEIESPSQAILFIANIAKPRAEGTPSNPRLPKVTGLEQWGARPLSLDRGSGPCCLFSSGHLSAQLASL